MEDKTITSGIRVDSDALEREARRQARQARARVFPVETRQGSWMVKRAVPGRGLFRALGGVALARFLTGQWSRLAPYRLGGSEQLYYESRRLQRLREAGERVPQVVVESGEHLILEDVGTHLTKIMRELDTGGQDDLLSDVAADLAAFHSRGHWHGGAQIRNHTLRDGMLYRIDFEDPLDRVMPLAARQAMDLMLLVHSTTAIKGRDLASHHRLGNALVERYFAVNPSPEVVAVIDSGRRMMAWVETALRWARHWTGKDMRRLWVSMHVLGTGLSGRLR